MYVVTTGSAVAAIDERKPGYEELTSGAAPIRTVTINSYFTCIRRDKHLVELGNRYMVPFSVARALSVAISPYVRALEKLYLLEGFLCTTHKWLLLRLLGSSLNLIPFALQAPKLLTK